MAHYAFLDDNNIVTEVIVGVNENNTDDLPNGFDSWEAFYLTQRPNASDCKRTSYNTRLGAHTGGGSAYRGNFAGIGMKYDETNDIFIAQKPFNSWTLNTTDCCWEAPIDYPTDGNFYLWDEEVYDNDTSNPKVAGWVEQ